MHWSEVSEIRGAGVTEAAGEFLASVERAVEIADYYAREMKVPVLLAELPCEVLDGATRAADRFFVRGEPEHEFLPVVRALTFAARALLYQTGEAEALLGRGEPESPAGDGFEQEYRRLCVFLFVEKMRRMGVWEKSNVPFDPWDESARLICEGVQREQMGEFLAFLGYQR